MLYLNFHSGCMLLYTGLTLQKFSLDCVHQVQMRSLSRMTPRFLALGKQHMGIAYVRMIEKAMKGNDFAK